MRSEECQRIGDPADGGVKRRLRHRECSALTIDYPASLNNRNICRLAGTDSTA
jgi:hypothetical protein